MDPDLRRVIPNEVQQWAKRNGLPFPWTYWQADAVPVDKDGLAIFDWLDKVTPQEYFAKSEWTDAAMIQRGPYPCEDGAIVSPLVAADVTGMRADECAALSDRWYVIVRWFDDESAFIYRWHTYPGARHISALGKDGYERRGEEPVEHVARITPCWSRDWDGLVQ